VLFLEVDRGLLLTLALQQGQSISFHLMKIEQQAQKAFSGLLYLPVV